MDLGSRIEDYHFDLDEKLIAQRPLEQRDAARLLVVRRHPSQGLPQREDAKVSDLPEILKADERFSKAAFCMRNRSRVFPARFYARRASGSLHEIVLIEELRPRVWKAIIKKSAKLKYPEKLIVEGVATLELSAVSADTLEFSLHRLDLLKLLEKCGEMPLPPYIKTRISEVDKNRYQSVWAASMDSAKSAAAPTASLHFTDELCRRLESQQLEFIDSQLHVGLGTFEALRHSELDKNELHSEAFSLSQKYFDMLVSNETDINTRKSILCVGTTSLRLLESLPLDGKSLAEAFEFQETSKEYLGRTKIFIKAGFKFRYCDALLSNFHLPASSLIVLMSAFAGSWGLVKESYEYAQSKGYRFFSYGDASLWL